MRRDRSVDRHLVMLSKDHQRFAAVCRDDGIRGQSNELYSRIAGVLALFTHVPLPSFRMIADISDGECSGPGLVSFCSRDAGAILIPDHLFVRNRGYEEFRQSARKNRTPWRARSERIVWRGTSTGQGRNATDDLSPQDPNLRLRVRLCLRLLEVPGTDAKISAIAQTADRQRDAERLARAGILGEFIPALAWNDCKFAIDVDGNSNAWSNLFTRLLLGNCVLKVASPENYRQWYYDELKPWTHYVPVKPDLSDLTAQIDWCRANPEACERIAADGQAFAMARRYDTEVVAAVGRLLSAFRAGRLRSDLT